MIVRIWHGVTLKSKSEEFFEYVKRTGVKDCRTTEGNRGVFVFRRIHDDKSHFLFLSFWDSLETVPKFAGKNIEKAVYYPEDKNYLLELEPTVLHYEVLNNR